MAHLRGQYVNLLLKSGSSYAAIASSTNCSIDIKANTADSVTKDSPGGGDFDYPEFTNYSYSISNESFVVNPTFLWSLLEIVISGNALVDFQFGNSLRYANAFAKTGQAYISSLTIEAANNDFVKLSLSLEGNGPLSNSSAITPAYQSASRVKGKTFMVALNFGGTWKTIACSTSHKFTVNCNLVDISDKDSDDTCSIKEVTGRTFTLSTENLIENIQSTNEVSNGADLSDLYFKLISGSSVTARFGYYPSSEGIGIHGEGGSEGWGGGEGVLIEGNFLVTSININAAVKELATYSAEFQSQGLVSLGTASQAAALAASLSDSEDASQGE